MAQPRALEAGLIFGSLGSAAQQLGEDLKTYLLALIMEPHHFQSLDFENDYKSIFCLFQVGGVRLDVEAL